MDTLAHFLWTYIIFYRYKFFKRTLLIGILPDLLSWTIYLFYSIITNSHFGKPNLTSIPGWVFTLYGITHSVFVFALVFLLIILITKNIPYYLFAWLIHIIIDIPTHSREFLPTPFLWPVSNWYFPGFSWGTPKFMLINYLFIFILLALTLIYKKNVFGIKLKSNH